VVLDVGTNNQQLLNDPSTWGGAIRASRAKSTTSSSMPSSRRPAPLADILLQFEDFAQGNATAAQPLQG
jgi:hypothetical protein